MDDDLLFGEPIEHMNFVLVDDALLWKAQRRIRSCEYCNPEDAPFSLDTLLDHLTGFPPLTTDYLLLVPAHCPRCRLDLWEKTGVEWYPEDHGTAAPTDVPVLSASR